MIKKTKGERRVPNAVSFRARVFKNGGSQAVRLPRECRVDAEEVLVRKVGRTIVLEPLPRDWDGAFEKLFLRGPPDPTFPNRQQPAWDDRL